MPVRRGLHGPQSTARVRQRRGAVWGNTEAQLPVRGQAVGPFRHASRYGKLV
ncbi:hypothetical protein STRIP9103_07395 [Streptomyces ipomoeae 91-03]|uniref:Uncharacterized protein n=1 Tax=Streptomyces ipomoeae 91-03 TaxID=698759 RepID=L1KMU8_9ACTN|nr:hypothetical protein STRIP9103_07395 [Streptomyces ipomoeae 91-03]